MPNHSFNHTHPETIELPAAVVKAASMQRPLGSVRAAPRGPLAEDPQGAYLRAGRLR